MSEYPASVQPFEVPDAHRSFFEELGRLIAKHPDSARDFGMIELNVERERQRVIIWECHDFGGFPDCEPKVRKK